MSYRTHAIAGALGARHDISRCCGADRDRTDDLRLAKPALSQLSYSPGVVARTACALPAIHRPDGRRPADKRVGQGRLELPTSRLSGVRSNHLSYWPGKLTAMYLLSRDQSLVPENRVLFTTRGRELQSVSRHFSNIASFDHRSLESKTTAYAVAGSIEISLERR